MRRVFAKNLLFVVGINLLVKPVWVFAIDRTVQNRVGHAEFGIYGALLNFAIIFQILLDFGLNSYTSRKISADPWQLPKLFPALLGARLVLMGLYAGVVMAVALLLNYRGSAILLLAGTLLIQTLTILLLFVRSNIAALQRFKLDGVLSITDRGLMILACGVLLWMPGLRDSFSISSFVIAQISCYVAAVALGFFMLQRITKASLWPALKWNLIKPVFKEGAPYALLTFLMAVYMRSDSILLERLVNDTEAGIYTSAYRLLDVGNMIAIIIAGILLPLFGRMLSQKQDVSPIVKLSVNLLLPVSVIVCLCAWVFGTPIMQLLYAHPAPNQGLIFAFVMTAFPSYSLMYVYSTLLTAAGKIGLLNKMAAFGVVLNLSLNFWLIPQQGALGAAIGACVTQGILALFSLYFTASTMALQKQPRWLLAHISYAFIMLGAALAVMHWDAGWMLRIACFVIFGGLLFFPFRFISLKSLSLLANR